MVVRWAVCTKRLKLQTDMEGKDFLYPPFFFILLGVTHFRFKQVVARFIGHRDESSNYGFSPEALVKMSADKSTAESELQIIRDKLEEAEKNQVDVREFQVENAKLQENLSNVGELRTQVTEELNLRERRDELQEHVQELTADVSRLEAELPNKPHRFFGQPVDLIVSTSIAGYFLMSPPAPSLL